MDRGSDAFFEDKARKPKDGDRNILETLFIEHSGRLYQTAFRMCGNNEDAEDVVQKTYMQAYLNIGSFRAESGAYTWLYAIAKNQCLRLLEKRGRSRFSSMEALIEAAHSDETGDRFPAPEKQFYIRQVKDGCLLGLLRCLPFSQRMAFILHVLLGMRMKDVSAVLGKTENAVRLLVHRARRGLKGFLCRNCSLYEAHNPCCCENLVRFSLKQGWIRKADGKTDVPRMNIEIASIESEIGDLRRITRLFESLEDGSDTEELLRAIKEKLTQEPYRIFSGKK